MDNPSDNTQALPAGTRIEEFIIEKVLGAGGFGITYLARDTGLNRHVVIKENLPAQFAWRETTTGTVRPRHTSGGDADDYQWSMNNFLREAETLASLDHSGIVRVLRKFEANGTAYFVMPFVDGVALDTLIEDRRGQDIPFTEDELRGLLERVLGALGYLHDRGIYHRDIKPGNILISNDGVPALIDFGSARQRLSERSMTVVESAGYTPFEQLQTRGNVGPWSDLYALGGTLAKAITGHAPPKANDRMIDDPWQGLANHPKAKLRYSKCLLASIDKALEVNAGRRWQSAEQWREALEAKEAAPPVELKELRLRVNSLQNPSNHRPELIAKNPSQDKAQRQPPIEPQPFARRPPLTSPDPVDKWGGEQMAPSSAGIVAEFMYDPEPQESMPPARRSTLGLKVALGIGIAVVVVAGWAIKLAGSDGNPAVGTTVAEEPQPPSPFLAASEKPTAWLKMAEAGDPLAQALLGDALYWGGQIQHGIEKDPAAGVKWIDKSSNAAHPLGKFLMGLLKEQDGKWVPFNEESAELDYTEAVGLGLVRDAEHGGPVWWTALAQALEAGKGIEPDPAAAVGWYRRAAEAGYVDGMNGLAECYANGSGVDKDPEEVVKWYIKVAEAGDASAQTRLGICYADGKGVPKDPAEAVKWYQKAADQGNAEAQNLLGFSYEFGDGVTESATMAVKWYRKAAEQGDPEGQCNLGDCYRYGEGVTQDAKEAVKWYRLAADQEDPFAQNSLGECYLNGVGVPNDPAEAFGWFSRAAEAGDSNAQVNLGICYKSGSGVDADPEEAFKLYLKAAEQDHPFAQVLLGDCYANGVGVSQDHGKAVVWYRKAADAGFAAGQYRLGLCYYEGNGVSKNTGEAFRWIKLAAEQDHMQAQNDMGYCYENGEGVAKDPVEAAKWYQKSAEQGHADAQCTLGDYYANGEGKMKNPTEAVKWYRKAAEQGHMHAQFNLGYSYEQGSGISKDHTEAAKWYEKAAQQGHAIAQNDLGVCYADGKGVPKNPVLGYMWTGLAAESGNAQSKENLKIISSEMTAAQIVEAKRMGREWKAKHQDPFAE